MRSQRFAFFSEDVAKDRLEDATNHEVRDSLEYFFHMADNDRGLHEYQMNGEQEAETTVTHGGQTWKFHTTHNMHSEMVAINHMLEQGYWQLVHGRLLHSDGNAITGADFGTTAPHCGHCTVTLGVLGLPHSSPSKGRFNLAGNFEYPLPPKVENDPMVLTRYRHQDVFRWPLFKSDIDHMVNIDRGWALKVNDLTFVDPAGNFVDQIQDDIPVLSTSEWSEHRWVKKVMWRQIWECIVPLLDAQKRD